MEKTVLERIVVTVGCVCISIIDIFTLKIPDRIVGPLFLFVSVYGIYRGEPMVMKLCSGAGMFALFWCIYRITKGLGFGDVKLAGVIGYALGFEGAVYACLAGSLIGIAFVLISAAARGSRFGQKGEKIPFAPFISAGTILVYIVQEVV